MPAGVEIHAVAPAPAGEGAGLRPVRPRAPRASHPIPRKKKKTRIGLADRQEVKRPGETAEGFGGRAEGRRGTRSNPDPFPGGGRVDGRPPGSVGPGDGGQDEAEEEEVGAGSEHQPGPGGTWRVEKENRAPTRARRIRIRVETKGSFMAGPITPSWSSPNSGARPTTRSRGRVKAIPVAGAVRSPQTSCKKSQGRVDLLVLDDAENGPVLRAGPGNQGLEAGKDGDVVAQHPAHSLSC